MPCYSPLRGYRSKSRTENGKRGIVFNRKDGYVDQVVELPCGKCIGCRLEYSRQWAIRCMHEASLHEENSFITLTYAPEHMPLGSTLVKDDWVKFFKRLRYHYDSRIRFFMCGEYGDETLRPHYHACVFGYRPGDLRRVRRTDEQVLFTSASLERIWGHGYVTVGDVSFESAGYCARYITKKVLGEAQKHSYWRIDEESGIIYQVAAEFALMSRGDRSGDPVYGKGIGHGWIHKYGAEVVRHDSIIVNGHEVLPPDYYDNQLSELQKQRVKARRKRKAQKDAANNTLERLRVRQDVKTSQLKNRRNSI